MRAVVRLLLAAAALLAAVLACAQPAFAVPPTATGLPAMTGDARVGQAITSTTGTWSGTAPMTYVRSWLRCADATIESCSPIVGASSATYVLTSADEGRVVRVRVTASNVDGDRTIASAASAVVAPRMPPVGEDAPEITGPFVDGQPLASTNGTWTGTTPITLTRRWQRCDATTGSCTDLTATTSSYTPVSQDVGSRLAVVVTATNADGFQTRRSALTPVIAPTAPVNQVLPSTGGAMREGQIITNSNPGTWKGTTPMDFARQWFRCDPSGSDCALIAGATSSSYVATAADVGATLRIAVTATNAAGPVTSTSPATVVIAPKSPPVASAPPSITGTATDGLELTAVEGTWTGTSSITRALRWLRCTDATLASCTPIAGQTSPRLKLASADVDRLVRLEVTATNPDGTTVERSAPTATVAPAQPANTAAPAVTGTLREAQVLTASRGTWTGTPTIAYEHQWYRCTGADCDAIAGETALSYRLGPLDVGRTIRHSVVATNAAPASTTAWSVPTAQVAPGPPVASLPPVIDGAVPRDGETWTGTLGTWHGTAPLQQRRQWLSCSSTGAACVAIPGAIDATLRLRPADVGRTVRLEVTTENTYGTVKALSTVSPVIAPVPPNAETAPVVTGALRDGSLLGAGGSWSGTPTITFSHVWQRCQALADVCQDIAGATSATYRATPADVGSRLRVRVDALNGAGGGTATSAISGVVQHDPPASTVTPALTGAIVEQSTVTASTGTFTGTGPLTYAYQWERCDDRGEGLRRHPRCDERLAHPRHRRPRPHAARPRDRDQRGGQRDGDHGDQLGGPAGAAAQHDRARRLARHRPQGRHHGHGHRRRVDRLPADRALVALAALHERRRQVRRHPRSVRRALRARDGRRRVAPTGRRHRVRSRRAGLPGLAGHRRRGHQPAGQRRRPRRRRHRARRRAAARGHRVVDRPGPVHHHLPLVPLR
jgi:hypothetical protein